MKRTAHLSDKNLRDIILNILTTDNRTKCNNLRVGVSKGIAHLAGKVESLLVRDSAEELVANVKGVRGVVNRIEAPGAPSPSRVINLKIKK